jgi:hypothetical protein
MLILGKTSFPTAFIYTTDENENQLRAVAATISMAD